MFFNLCVKQNVLPYLPAEGRFVVKNCQYDKNNTPQIIKLISKKNTVFKNKPSS